MKRTFTKHSFVALTAAAFVFVSGCSTSRVAEVEEDLHLSSGLAGHVLVAGKPVAGATVTLYEAGTGAPQQLAQGKTDGNGAFKLDARHADGRVLYVVAKGGTPKAGAGKGPNDALALLTILSPEHPTRITVNEYTTLASVWTGVQFLDGDKLSGTKLGLRIAASNVPNFVDLATGGYGVTIQDPLNAGQSPTMANFATLANVLAGAAAQVTPDATSRFLAAAKPRDGKVPADTLTALEGVARDSGYKPERLFELLDAFYPVEKGKQMRPTPFMPYLTWSPSAWVLPLRFSGGGLSAPGKIMFDSQGNLWAGNNFIVGFQNQDSLWAGGISKFAPNGRPLSPMTFGFTGGGAEGFGFGVAIDAHDNYWGTTYGSRTVVKFDNQGKPLSPPEGYNFDGQLGLMQGIIATPNGDVWALDIERSQIAYFPKGDPSKAKLLFQNKTGDPKDNPGKLFAPFHLAIDQQDRIWVGNALGDWVSRFPASDPSPGKVETFKVGLSPSGMAIDSKGNVWVTCRFPSSEQGRKVLDEMLEAAKARQSIDVPLARAMYVQKAGPDGGTVVILRPDGSPAREPIMGSGLAGPWGAVVDGNDHVWISNFANPTVGIVELAGCRSEANPPGFKMGDPISPSGGYVGGGLQSQIDIAIDPAGNVWVGNNWNNFDAAIGRVAEPLQTQGGGQGVVVFYGMAKPVRTPQIGPAQPAM